MASLIKIKRTTTANLPSPAEQGELVYVYDTTNADSGNGGAGKRLYIGDPNSSTNSPIAIGGQYFTDLIDHAPGTLTSGSALIVDDNSKIDIFNVDNLTLDGNTISSTNTNGNITLDPDGTGYVQITGTNGLVLPVGTTAEQGPSVQGAIRYNTTSASFEGYSGTDWGSLGGVIDIDQDTYITAEETADEDILRFYNAGAESLNIQGTSINVASTVTTTNINATTTSTSTTTGALVVDGGVGIAGALYVGGLINADSATFSSINNTPIGDTTPSTGAFTTLSSSGEATLASAIVSDLTATRVTFAGASGALTDSADLTFSGSTLTATNLSVGTQATLASAAVSDLTATRVTFAGTSGELSDSADLTFSGSTLTATNLSVGTQATLASAAISDLTSGRIVLAGTSGELGDSTNLTFDGTVLTTTEAQVDNINIDQNTISSTDTDGDIVLDPNGTGAVDVSGARITSVGDPTQATDAVNKQYVDAVAEGLHVHEQVHAIITTPLATITGDTVTYDNGTDGVGATLTLGTAIDIAGGDLDGDTDITVGERLIVAGESNAAHNGIYVLTSTTVLTRSEDFDTPTEMGGGDFVFVTHGTTYADTGWVLSEPVGTVGTDNVVWVQFSGAGAYTAGAGISQDGTTFNVEVAASGGIEIVNDALQLKAGVAGAGLTYTNGVVDIVGTADRITVNTNDIDIASTYAGQTSITTLGTIGTGTWQGSVIANAYIAEDLTIAGGSINNTPIGATTANTGAFTTLTASGEVDFTNTTDSSSLTTGAVVISGGVAINKALYVGTNLVGALDVDSNPTSNLNNFIVDGGTY